MSEKYDPKKIEKKWQNSWEASGIYETREETNKVKWYSLTMFVYPSGDIHAGHWYAFIPSDVFARWKRMNGYNVFFPVGFDAFGLPAENAAIKRNIHPQKWTYANIERMRRQLRRMGAMWAWKQEVITCDTEYYKWTQWLFLKFYDAGLVYREYAPVDWCPSCNTTLAREQVWGEDRYCERCRTPVIRKNLEQWKFKITNYADELLEGLSQIDWPSPVKTMQTNWIGKSFGCEIFFTSESSDLIPIFTTRPDTIGGATFLVLAPEHPLVDKITIPSLSSAVQVYQEQTSRQDDISRSAVDREKTGVFTGSYVVNPVNGKKLPVWIADYVMMGYGTGAIMAVPAHDERDFQFAQKYNLPIKIVIQGATGKIPYTFMEGTLINSEQFNGLAVNVATEQIIKWLEATGKGKKSKNYKLHDWLISRQRMWGAPIPILYCPNCGTLPVPYNQLPVILPEDAEFKPTGESPLKYHDGFRFTECPKCGCQAERETDTLDTFVCSSWYQYAYISPNYKNGEPLSSNSKPWDSSKGDYWLPVDQYTGGIEHATMHLLYTRFFTKAMRDMGLVNFDEPMIHLFNQGMILGPDGEKMSKSRGNVINPEEFVDKYGADTVRGYMMFIGPWDQGGPWDPSAIEGISRFLHRFWGLVLESSEHQATTVDKLIVKKIRQRLHQTIIDVTMDIANFKFNTAISALMELNNFMLRTKKNGVISHPVWQEAIETMITLMAPFFPHIAEETWYALGHSESVHLQAWPKGDPEKAMEENITIVIQVNGKVRSRLHVNAGLSEQDVKRMVLELAEIKKITENITIDRILVIPDKLVNIVVR